MRSNTTNFNRTQFMYSQPIIATLTNGSAKELSREARHQVSATLLKKVRFHQWSHNFQLFNTGFILNQKFPSFIEIGKSYCIKSNKFKLEIRFDKQNSYCTMNFAFIFTILFALSVTAKPARRFTAKYRGLKMNRAYPSRPKFAPRRYGSQYLLFH